MRLAGMNNDWHRLARSSIKFADLAQNGLFIRFRYSGQLAGVVKLVDVLEKISPTHARRSSGNMSKIKPDLKVIAVVGLAR